jgi:hypothetical protein
MLQGLHLMVEMFCSHQGLTNSSWTSRRISYCQSSKEQFSNTSTKYLLSKAFPFMLVNVCSEKKKEKESLGGFFFFVVSRIAGFEIHTFWCTDESHAELLKECLKALPITLSLQHQATLERLTINIAHTWLYIQSKPYGSHSSLFVLLFIKRSTT